MNYFVENCYINILKIYKIKYYIATVTLKIIFDKYIKGKLIVLVGILPFGMFL